jgi:hypothetical protein
MALGGAAAETYAGNGEGESSGVRKNNSGVESTRRRGELQLAWTNVARQRGRCDTLTYWRQRDVQSGGASDSPGRDVTICLHVCGDRQCHPRRPIWERHRAMQWLTGGPTHQSFSIFRNSRE